MHLQKGYHSSSQRLENPFLYELATKRNNWLLQGKLAYECARLLEKLGADVRTYDPSGLPVRDPALEEGPKAGWWWSRCSECLFGWLVVPQERIGSFRLQRIWNVQRCRSQAWKNLNPFCRSKSSELCQVGPKVGRGSFLEREATGRYSHERINQCYASSGCFLNCTVQDMSGSAQRCMAASPALSRIRSIGCLSIRDRYGLRRWGL